ncbi:hypothetical protein G5B35_06675 [Parapusillimonas sp. SGNA-6]|nr:hypothetical protein [Parapusillimonas sp. SGNA-6]
MYKSPHIFTLRLLAPHFQLSEEELGDMVYSNLNVEDGLMWIIGPENHEEIGLTFLGIENIAEILADLGNEKAAQVLKRHREGTFSPSATAE